MSHGTRPSWRASLAIVAIAATVAACGGIGSGAAASADPTRDKLAQIMARGTLVAYAATDYPPQSIVVEGASRAASTKCKPNQMTADELTGFDIETTKVVAEKLGVEVCFVVPTWTEATAGNWNDRMDIVYGSGAINATRMEHLYMTQPYYYVPQRFVVRAEFGLPEAVRSGRQDDRHVLPAARSSPTSRAPSRSLASTWSRRSRIQSSKASRPRNRASKPWLRATWTRSLPPSRSRSRRSTTGCRCASSTRRRSRCTRRGSSTRVRACPRKPSWIGSTRSSAPPTPTGR